MADQPTLKRGLGLPLLVLYGLGTTVGAGIFVLVGEIAGIAGPAAPLSFLIASVLAGLTALSFGEMATRFPVSAGEAAYVQAGLGSRHLATLVGFLVIAAGTVSSAAIVNGFVGYFEAFVEMPDWSAILLITLVLATLAIWGIVESVIVAAVVTLIEVGGLILVVIVAGDNFVHLPRLWDEFHDLDQAALIMPVLTASALAFYAFIGFEDMVNLSEEVRNVENVMKNAIITTLAVTAVLYVSVSTISILTVPASLLGESRAPLALIYETATGSDPYIISAIGVIAVINGALIQMIMAARVVYGLASRGMLPASLGLISARTLTPVRATMLVAAMVLTLAILLPIVPLAQLTSLATLTVFALVNLSLYVLLGSKAAPSTRKTLPRWVPALGFLASGAFALFQIYVLVAG
ncbi:MAG: APC family permease [Alphaproteobacteria bacterium]